jgi:hypothetical protein
MELSSLEIAAESMSSSRGGGGAGGSGEARGEQQYNPYAGLAATFDPQAAARSVELPENPQFLFSEDANAERRTLSENLTFCAGVGYGGGSLLGGTVGGARALRGLFSPSSDAQLSRKLVANRLLNEGGMVGRRTGNAAGSVGLFYAAFDSGLGKLRDRYDSTNCIAAGALSGALFRAPHGPRPAAIFAASGAAFAAACIGARSIFSL